MKISKHARGNYYTTFKGKFIYGSTPEEVEEKYDELKYQYRQGYNVDKNPTLEDYMVLRKAACIFDPAAFLEAMLGIPKEVSKPILDITHSG